MKSSRGRPHRWDQSRSKFSVCKQETLGILSVDSKLGPDLSGYPRPQIPGTNILVHCFGEKLPSIKESRPCPPSPHGPSETTLTKICAVQKRLVAVFLLPGNANIFVNLPKSNHLERLCCLWEAWGRLGWDSGTLCPHQFSTDGRVCLSKASAFCTLLLLSLLFLISRN